MGAAEDEPTISYKLPDFYQIPQSHWLWAPRMMRIIPGLDFLPLLWDHLGLVPCSETCTEKKRNTSLFSSPFMHHNSVLSLRKTRSQSLPLIPFGFMQPIPKAGGDSMLPSCLTQQFSRAAQQWGQAAKCAQMDQVPAYISIRASLIPWPHHGPVWHKAEELTSPTEMSR